MQRQSLTVTKMLKSSMEVVDGLPVCGSRSRRGLCVELYREIVKLRPRWQSEDIEELIQLAKEMREANARGESLGLKEDELARRPIRRAS